MKRHDFTFVALVLCMLSFFGYLAYGQSKPADPPAKVPLAPSVAKDELWTAVHKRDMAQKQIADLSAKFAQLQNQATQQMQTLQAQEKQAENEIEAAKPKAFAAAKLDPSKYDLDLDTLEVSPKPEPKAEAKK